MLNSIDPKMLVATKLLIATPYIQDKRFSQSIVYICGYDNRGTMGIVINKPAQHINSQELLNSLNIKDPQNNLNIMWGGPKDINKGFILHSHDMLMRDSIILTNTIALTNKLDMLKLIATNHGPNNFLLAMGYLEFNNSELDYQIHSNQWILTQAKDSLVFNKNYHEMYKELVDSLGLGLARFSFLSGTS